MYFHSKIAEVTVIYIHTEVIGGPDIFRKIAYVPIIFRSKSTMVLPWRFGLSTNPVCVLGALEYKYCGQKEY